MRERFSNDHEDVCKSWQPTTYAVATQYSTTKNKPTKARKYISVLFNKSVAFKMKKILITQNVLC